MRAAASRASVSRTSRAGFGGSSIPSGKQQQKAPLAAPKQQQQRPAKAAAKAAAASSSSGGGDSSYSSAVAEKLAAENAALRSEVERALAALSSSSSSSQHAAAVVEAFEARDAALRAELQRAEEAERAAAVAATAAAAKEEEETKHASPAPPAPAPPAPAPAAVLPMAAEGVAASVSPDGTILFSFSDDSAAAAKSKSKAGALPARRASAVAAAVAAVGASRAGSGVGGRRRKSGLVARALPPSSGAGASPSSGGGASKKQGAAAGGKNGEKAPSSSSSSSSPVPAACSAVGGGGGGAGGASSSAKASVATTVVSTPPPPPPLPKPSALDLAVAAADRALAAGDEDAFDAAVDSVLAEVSKEGSQEKEAAGAKALAALAAATRSAAASALAAPPPAAGRGDWVYFTVPRRPVAGGKCVVFYNLSNGSDGGNALRGSGAGSGASLRLHARCNGWSLPLATTAVAGSSDHFPLPAAPAGPAAPDGSGNWHAAALDLPSEAFELDFVVEAVAAASSSGGSDAASSILSVDNNAGGDFVVPLASAMTPRAWGELALERAAAEAEARREAEREAERAAAEEAERRARADDAARGRERAAAAVAAAREARALGIESATPLWTTSPRPLVAGGGGVLYFNAAESAVFRERSGGKPLKRAPVLHLGFNRWELPRDVEFVRCEGPPEVVAAAAAAAKKAAAGSSPASSASSSSSPPSSSSGGGGDWWRAPLAARAADGALSFVVRASFGENEGDDVVVDNNGGGDFFVAVQPPPAFLKPDGTTVDEEAWAASLAPELELDERRRREAAAARAAASAAARAQARADAAAKAAAVRRRQQRHVLYTDPEPLRAGEKTVLKYNPRDTPLSGAGRVFARVGFNRWSHPRGFEQPVEMQPPPREEDGGGGGHFSLEVDVPRSAYSLQAVFSDSGAEGGGHARYDNRGGADYQLPVEGSPLAEPGLHVVHVAVEMAPIAKVGGLGDVVTALGRAVQESGHLVEVVVPRFGFFSQSPLLGAMTLDCEFDYGGTHVWVSSCVVEGLRTFFVEPADGKFANGGVYGDSRADAARFGWFCGAALEFLLQSGRQPDIIHCHDWSTAPVAGLLWQNYHSSGLGTPRAVFTIHNADFGLGLIGDAAHHSQAFTTVSPSYAHEISGLPAIAPNAHKLSGVRNGIDPDIWDPSNDPFLPVKYGSKTAEEGKRAAREALRQRLGLTGWGDRPVVAVVSRLTEQKGVHLIEHAAWRALDRGAQFVLLGSAPDPKVQGRFDALAGRLTSENAAFVFAFDEPLSHLIYAGADMIVMPSMFEPCGLAQLISCAYGTVPVVRSTGGLHDTVFDVDYDKARAAWEVEGSSDWERDGLDVTNGFSFEGTDAGALDSALNRALDAYYNDREWFRGLQSRIMLTDWSWARPAIDYVEIYRRAAGQ